MVGKQFLLLTFFFIHRAIQHALRQTDVNATMLTYISKLFQYDALSVGDERKTDSARCLRYVRDRMCTILILQFDAQFDANSDA